MPRPLAAAALVLGLAVFASADDPKADKKPGKPPDWAGYVPFGDPVVVTVKEAGDETLSVTVQGPAAVRLSGYGRRPRVSVKEGKKETVELTFHPDGVVRWAKLPPKWDDKGKRQTYKPKEAEALRQPRWAFGYAADRSDLAAGQPVEITLLRPKTVPAEKLTPEDLRIKQVVILVDPPPPGEKKKDETKEKKDKK
ncbi:MAG: hypothetical protein U0871_17085 [Gemmataceae bacterium]